MIYLELLKLDIYPCIYQLSCTTLCFFTHHVLVLALRLSVFINAICRERQSTYISFTTHQLTVYAHLMAV